MKRNSRRSGSPAILRGKVCLVTGGAQGIGLAVTRALARQGAHVHVAEISPDNPKSATANLDAAGLGPQVTFHHVDVGDRSTYEQCIADVHATGGRLDVLLNNAAFTPWRDVQDMSVEDALMTMRTGYDAMVCGVTAALPLMRAANAGHIVTMGSAAGVIFVKGPSAAYAAANAAINAYTQILSGELATSPVHVMLVRLGPVAVSGQHAPSHRMPRIADFLPVSTPEQVADAIVDGLLTRREIIDVPRYLPAIYRAYALAPGAVRTLASLGSPARRNYADHASRGAAGRPRPGTQALADDLASRVINKIGPARWVGAVTRAVVVPLDTALQEKSLGRLSVGRGLGMTTLLLTTTRARTGQRHLTPLFYVDHAGGYAVVGSNFGLEHHPAWTTDLLTNPAATITTTGQQTPVTARLVNSPEREEIWTKLLNLFAGYQTYSDRSGRKLRIFHLQPTTPPCEGVRNPV
jgi:deazaflavin-dependent oxidoreductase (nitroreductase family)